jgi:hypothetical protein
MTDTDKPTRYGHYRIIERYQVPGRPYEFVLAHEPDQVQPWAVGGGVRQGDYFHEETTARTEYVARIADSLDLIVAPGGAAVIAPQERTSLTELTCAYREAATAFEQSEIGPDGDETETAVALRDAADRLAMQLHDLGVISGVYDDWEMDGYRRWQEG